MGRHAVCLHGGPGAVEEAVGGPRWVLRVQGTSGVLLPGEPGDSGDSGDFPWAVEDWGEAAGWVAWRDSGSEAHLLQLKVTGQDGGEGWVRMVGKDWFPCSRIRGIIFTSRGAPTCPLPGLGS